MNEQQTTEQQMQYLTFYLDDELYAFNVLQIKEVLELPRVTKMPKTPPFMAGVINLRGGVVPVIDLRRKFEMDEVEPTVDTSIIIVEIEDDGEVIFIGALVDSVKAVIKINSNDMEPPPRVGMNLETEFIESIGKYENNFVIIVNINRLFSLHELSFAREITEKPETQKQEQKIE